MILFPMHEQELELSSVKKGCQTKNIPSQTTDLCEKQTQLHKN